MTGPFDKPPNRTLVPLNFQGPLSVLQKFTKENKEKLKADWIIQKLRG